MYKQLYIQIHGLFSRLSVIIKSVLLIFYLFIKVDLWQCCNPSFSYDITSPDGFHFPSSFHFWVIDGETFKYLFRLYNRLHLRVAIFALDHLSLLIIFIIIIQLETTGNHYVLNCFLLHPFSYAFINSIIGMAANVGHYTKVCDDEWVVIRFVDELKVIAMFVGPSYSLSDLRSSARRIWPRYFGASAVPFNFFERLFPLMKIVANSRSIILDGHLSKCFLGQPCYPLGDALYELVAVIVFKRWFGDCPYPTIPFEYIELAGNGPPDLIAVYEPEFPGRGSCSIFLFPSLVKFIL